MDGSKAMGVDLTKEGANRLFIYHSELEKWNRKVNLVSRKQPDWVRIHFLDSLVPLGMGLISGSERTVDLGAGAGFPGVPLKVARPGLKLDLAEASGKKCAWLSHLLRTLELKDARVLSGRFEDLLEEGPGGQYDLVVSRAAARPKEVWKWADRFLVPGGKALIYTTRALVDEGVGVEHPYTVPGSKVPSVIWEVPKR
ncbi:MAG: 16S rRNA (guanine(527)-N(7))-methyltransferase RsmG [bacterium]|nr:16S rRNA (guanine(527)-N(7))-methyltransferase RsmG [bacterium]